MDRDTVNLNGSLTVRWASWPSSWPARYPIRLSSTGVESRHGGQNCRQRRLGSGVMWLAPHSTVVLAQDLMSEGRPFEPDHSVPTRKSHTTRELAARTSRRTLYAGRRKFMPAEWQAAVYTRKGRSQ